MGGPAVLARALAAAVLARGARRLAVGGADRGPQERQDGDARRLLALYELLYAEGARRSCSRRPRTGTPAGCSTRLPASFAAPELSELLRVRDHAGEIVREDGLGIIYRLDVRPVTASTATTRRSSSATSSPLDDTEPAAATRRSLRAVVHGRRRRCSRSRPPARPSQRHDSILGRSSTRPRRRRRRRRARPDGLPDARREDAGLGVRGADHRPATTSKAMKLANPASWITEEYLRRQAETPS